MSIKSLTQILAVLLIWLCSSQSQARVFSFQTEDMAAYFRGTTGLSSVKQKPFAKSSGTATTLSDEEPLLNYGGEVGFLFKISPFSNLRFGIELMRTRASDVKGSASDGTKWFDLTSDVFVFNPMMTVEAVFESGETSRFVGYVGIGYASVRLENEYTMTAAGEAALVPSYKEKSTGSFVNGVIGVGWEALLVDNVTVLMDAGYRFLDVNKLKYSGNATVIGGSASKGSEVSNTNDGSKRGFDLGGPFLGLSFRFYIDVI